jgi:hypothetical protein
LLAVRLGDAEAESPEGDGVIRLITGYWRPKDPARAREIFDCLQRNLANPAIGTVTLVTEGKPFDEVVIHSPRFAPVAVEKLACVEGESLPGRRCHLSGRETYRMLFGLANRMSDPGDLVIVANADVYFDETVALLEECVGADTLACISRTEQNGMPPFWDVTHPERYGDPSKHWPNNSQDAWAFRAPIRDFRCDWALGVLGCDNRLATEAKAAGMRLVNPFPMVRAWHLHASPRPVVKKRPCVGGPFTDVPPTAGLFERAAVAARAD